MTASSSFVYQCRKWQLFCCHVSRQVVSSQQLQLNRSDRKWHGSHSVSFYANSTKGCKCTIRQQLHLQKRHLRQLSGRSQKYNKVCLELKGPEFIVVSFHYSCHLYVWFSSVWMFEGDTITLDLFIQYLLKIAICFCNSTNMHIECPNFYMPIQEINFRVQAPGDVAFLCGGI